MAQLVPSINLAKREHVDFIETFLGWALSIGRVVIMLTEIIALSTFLYRFSLDRQLIDLHDKIKQKQTIVELLKNNEDKYRDLQNRLSLTSKLTDESSKTTKLFIDVMDKAPIGFFINNLTVSGNKVKIDANATSLQSVTTFIASLRSYPKMAIVSLDKIDNKVSSAALNVAISAETEQ